MVKGTTKKTTASSHRESEPAPACAAIGIHRAEVTQTIANSVRSRSPSSRFRPGSGSACVMGCTTTWGLLPKSASLERARLPYGGSRLSRARFLIIASPDFPGHRVTLPSPLPEDSWAVDERSLQLFVDQLEQPPATRAWYELRREAERIALVPGFDRLITLDANAIKELPHQIDVAQRVLRDMGGRAILADEVGLGKTIEASIIYKELAIRGLARRALILTPASLVGQWQGELEEKFFERFDTPTDPDDWPRVTKAIISHDRARTRRHAEEILRHRWDLVIVDEAHKVKSHRGATYQFIEKIERDFILLLTATPLQNDLRELYREGFIQPAEQEEVEDEPRRRRPTKRGILQLALIHLRQRLCSSSRALAESLAHLAESERISPAYRAIAQQLAKRAEGIKTHAKLDVLTKLLKETPDRLVVFSDHRPTIQLIEERVKKLGRQPIVRSEEHTSELQ